MSDNSKSKIQPKTRFVSYLPDLITEGDYLEPVDRPKLRVQIKSTEEGVEILGDSLYAALVEKMLTECGTEEIERMLCG